MESAEPTEFRMQSSTSSKKRAHKNLKKVDMFVTKFESYSTVLQEHRVFLNSQKFALKSKKGY